MNNLAIEEELETVVAWFKTELASDKGISYLFKI